MASNVHHVGLHQCYREIFIKSYLYFYLVLYLYCFLYHIFIPIHIFDLGESLPQWEQSQGREFKHNQPNEGRVFAKSGVSMKKVILQWLSLPWIFLRKPLIIRIGYYNLDATPLIGKIVDINVWDRSSNLISKSLSMVKVYVGFIPFIYKV